VCAGSGTPWRPHAQAEDEDEDHAGLHPMQQKYILLFIMTIFRFTVISCLLDLEKDAWHAFATPVIPEGSNERR
jgi:hypothetical protein